LHEGALGVFDNKLDMKKYKKIIKAEYFPPNGRKNGRKSMAESI